MLHQIVRPIYLSSHKESDIAMNVWQAAANMLEQCNKQMNSPRLLMTDIVIVHSIIKSFLEQWFSVLYTHK